MCWSLCRASEAEGRLAGEYSRHCVISWTSSWEPPNFLRSVSMYLLRLSTSFRGVSRLVAGSWYVEGSRSPGNSWIAVKRVRWPNENMSSIGPYLGGTSKASGGMYTIVPGTPLVMVLASWPGWTSTIRELPMSAILATTDEFSRTFLAVRSLWMMAGLRLWRYSNPLATSCRMEHFLARGMSGVFSSRSSRLSCSRSITSTGRLRGEPGWVSRKQMPRNWTMLGWRRSESKRHSS